MDCRKDPLAIQANLMTVARERFVEIEEGGFWDCDKDAIVGRPQVKARRSGPSFCHEEFDLSGKIPAEIADIQALPTSGHAAFSILAESGDLIRVEPRTGMVRRLMNLHDLSVVRRFTFDLD